MKNFAVVNFSADNTVEALPSTWLSSDGTKCSWPSTKKYPKNFKKSLRDPKSTPDPDWRLHDVVILKECDTYEKATKKCKALQYKSTAETTDVEGAPKSTDACNKEPAIIPESSFFKESSNLTQQSFILGPVPAAANAPIVDIPGTSMELGPSDIGNEFFSNSGLQNVEVNIATQEDVKEIMQEINEVKQEFRQFQEVFLNKVEDINQKLSDISSMVKMQLSSQVSAQNLQPCPVFKLIPLKTTEDLDKLESALLDPAAFNDLVKLLTRIGGNSATNHVNNILKSLFDKSICTQLRLTKTSGKYALKDTATTKAIREAVHAGSINGIYLASDSKIHHDIGRWLRNHGYMSEPRRSNDSTNHTSESKEAISSGSSESDLDEENIRN